MNRICIKGIIWSYVSELEALACLADKKRYKGFSIFLDSLQLWGVKQAVCRPASTTTVS